MLRTGVGVQVGQIVGPVLTVSAIKNMFPRMILPEVHHFKSLIRKIGLVFTERAFIVISSLHPNSFD